MVVHLWSELQTSDGVYLKREGKDEFWSRRADSDGQSSPRLTLNSLGKLARESFRLVTTTPERYTSDEPMLCKCTENGVPVEELTANNFTGEDQQYCAIWKKKV